MVATPLKTCVDSPEQAALIQGEILTKTYSYRPHGGSVAATMYVPMERSRLWQALTHYPNWTQFFPDIVQSEVTAEFSPNHKQLFQAARKTFLMLSIEVEIQLSVKELPGRTAIFEMVGHSGSFHDFSAEIQLQDFHEGTQLRYSVQATSKIPAPSFFIEQAMKLDLPMNMRHLRQVLLA